jgi:hypothetical protein
VRLAVTVLQAVAVEKHLLATEALEEAAWLEGAVEFLLLAVQGLAVLQELVQELAVAGAVVI